MNSINKVNIQLAPYYRNVVRACITTFGQDFTVSEQVRAEIKNMVRQNSNELDLEQLKAQLIDATNFILHNIIQARMNPNTGNYKVKILEEHVKKGDVINLRGYDPKVAHRLPWIKDPNMNRGKKES